MKYTYLSFFLLIGSISIFSQGIVSFEDTNGKYGLKDSTGKVIKAGIYDNTGYRLGSLFGVSLNGQWGFINVVNMKLIVPHKYEEVSMFTEDNTYATVSANGKWGVINEFGTLIALCKYNSSIRFTTNNIAIVELGNKVGVINKAGSFLLPCKYDEIKKFAENYAAISLNGKWGFINMFGKIVVPIEYAEVSNFFEGKARVRKVKGGDWKYIDQP